MNAKEYLQQGFYLDKKIESNLREVAELRHLCLGISAAGLEESHNPNRPTEAPFVRTIEKIWEREQEINQEVDRLVDLKYEIGQVIDRWKTKPSGWSSGTGTSTSMPGRTLPGAWAKGSGGFTPSTVMGWRPLKKFWRSAVHCRKMQ